MEREFVANYSTAGPDVLLPFEIASVNASVGRIAVVQP